MAQLDPAAIEAEIARRKAQGSWKGDQAPADTAAPATTPTETPAAVDPAALQAEIDRRNSPTGMVTGPSKAFATGVRQGAEGSVGAIGDAPGTLEGGAGWLLKKIGVDPAEAEKAAKAAASGVPDPLHPTIFLKILQAAGIISPEQAAKIGSPTSATVGNVTDAAVEKLPEGAADTVQDITRHEPVNKLEQFMQTGGNFAGGALLPGGPVARTARVVGPTIATEGAGAAAKAIDPELETAARTIAAIVSGGGVGAAENAFRTRRALRAVNTSPKAVERVQELMLAQGMSPDQAAARMRELGVGAMQVDTGPNVRQEAQQIQARGGRGRGLIDPTLREREANAQPRLEAETTSLVGPEQQKSDVLGALEDRMKAGGKKQDIAHPGQTQAIDLQPAVDIIDDAMTREKTPSVQSALKLARDMLHIKKTAPDQPDALETASEQVLAARRAVGNMLYDEKGNRREGLGREGPILDEVYRTINEAIDPANPELRAADAEISQAGKEKQAFEKGQRIYETGRDDPSSFEFARDHGPLSAGEKERLASGANVETWRLLNATGRDRAKLQSMIAGQGKSNFEKLATTFGPERAQSMLNALERERVFNETYQKVVQGSKTAETVGDKSPGFGGAVAQAVPEVAASSVLGPGAMAATALSHARRYLQEGLGRLGQEGKDADIAQLLMSEDPEAVMTAIQILRRRDRLAAGAAGGVVSGVLERSDREKK